MVLFSVRVNSTTSTWEPGAHVRTEALRVALHVFLTCPPAGLPAATILNLFSPAVLLQLYHLGGPAQTIFVFYLRKRAVVLHIIFKDFLLIHHYTETCILLCVAFLLTKCNSPLCENPVTSRSASRCFHLWFSASRNSIYEELSVCVISLVNCVGFE